MGYPARLLGRDEQIVMELRPHWKEIVWPTIILVIGSAIAGTAAGFAPEGGEQIWLRGLAVLIWLVVVGRWGLWPLLTWWFTQYTVTNRRLILRTGVLARQGHDIPLQRINDVSFAHNWFERILRCGTLTVESAGERGQIVLKDIPHVEDVQRDLYELVVRDQRDRLLAPDAERRPDSREDDVRTRPLQDLGDGT
jgi:uncharacterized membrane protein YdbT with pleckstrin-like domain